MKVKVEISGDVAALLDKLGTAYNIRSTSGPLRGSVRRAGVIEALATGRIPGGSVPEATCAYCKTWQPCARHMDVMVCVDRAACNARAMEGRE